MSHSAWLVGSSMNFATWRTPCPCHQSTARSTLPRRQQWQQLLLLSNSRQQCDVAIGMQHKIQIIGYLNQVGMLSSAQLTHVTLWLTERGLRPVPRKPSFHADSVLRCSNHVRGISDKRLQTVGSARRAWDAGGRGASVAVAAGIAADVRRARPVGHRPAAGAGSSGRGTEAEPEQQEQQLLRCRRGHLADSRRQNPNTSRRRTRAIASSFSNDFTT